MKHLLSLACALALASLPLPALAESLCTLPELPGATSPRWQLTWEAHGRTIHVDEEIFIPEAAAAPLLTVRAAPPLTEPLRSELTAWAGRMLEADPVNAYGFRTTAFSTSLTCAVPPGWGKTRDSAYNQGAMAWQSHALFDADPDAAHAQDNPLTLKQAAAIAREKAAALFPEEAFFLRHAAVFDRNTWRRTGEPINAMGHYHLELTQLFHDIPLLASVHSAFTRFSVGEEDPLLALRGLLSASVYGEEAYALTGWLYAEAEVIREDTPLLPFDAVRGQVEALIASGHVRFIDSVGLGYVQFDTEARDVQLLAPAWVIWCEYLPGGAEAERTRPLYADGLLQDGEYFRPLIILAETGAMLDPESEEPGRCLYPCGPGVR
ncbi:MAG: hypothetical protein ACI4ML_11655 [Aristaeellaceae bacterium]